MKVSLFAIPLTLSGFSLALPVTERSEDPTATHNLFARSVLCGINNQCELNDAKQVISDLNDQGTRLVSVGTSWVSLAYYADCNVYGRASSGTTSSY
jgi:hypothetical protein